MPAGTVSGTVLLTMVYEDLFPLNLCAVVLRKLREDVPKIRLHNQGFQKEKLGLGADCGIHAPPFIK